MKLPASLLWSVTSCLDQAGTRGTECGRGSISFKRAAEDSWGVTDHGVSFPDWKKKKPNHRKRNG